MFRLSIKHILYSIFSLVLFAIQAPHALAANSLPDGFQKSIVASGLHQPTALALTPDNRIFVTEKTGRVMVIRNGQLLSTPLMTLPVDVEGERGVEGISIDPNFSSNHHIYVYYVAKDIHVHISRFTVVSDSASLSSEKVLLDIAPAQNPPGLLHYAGTLRVGADGKLWASIGDNKTGANSQNLGNLFGKILRINLDGSVPGDNPYVKQAGVRPEIWAYGFRNPFRFNFLPNGKPIVGDVGENTIEEVDVVEKTGNYGWPTAEGVSTNPAFKNPLYSYQHNGASASVTGGFVYTGSQFPQAYKGAYFYGDYARGFIHTITLNASYDFVSEQAFDTAAGTVVDMTQGADGSMYYIAIYEGTEYWTSGKVLRIQYESGNLKPTAVISSDKNSGKKPLIVTFSSKGSFDPEGKPLTYKWDFGDRGKATDANPTHTYKKKGTFTATLITSDGKKDSDPASLTIISGNQAPEATILTPEANSKYTAGQVISYSGDGTDPEKGKLPESAFSWNIIFHHGTHTHPFLGPITGRKSGIFTIPNTGEASADTYYEIQLTVVDKGGLTDTTSQFIYPKTVNLNFKSSQSGTQFLMQDIPQTTDIIIKAVVGFLLDVDVSTPQKIGGTTYDFVSWSDNGAKKHTITTPEANTTYTITMQKSPDRGNIYFRVREVDETGKWLASVNGATAKLTDLIGNTVVATASSSVVNGQGGWVFFDNVPTGTYGIMTYKDGYTGIWKQTDCGSGGTLADATISNSNTAGNVAVFQKNVTVHKDAITYCQDAGLKVTTPSQNGSVYFRVRLVDNTGKWMSDVNDATSKLTDTAGNSVSQTQKSVVINDQGGWVHFDNVTPGTYGVMAYKTGLSGFWKQVDCTSTGSTTDATISNSNTEGTVAGWQNNVIVTAGKITWCKDVGLK